MPMVMGSPLFDALHFRLGLGLPFAFTAVHFYQAYCILLVHYCHVTRGGRIGFKFEDPRAVL